LFCIISCGQKTEGRGEVKSEKGKVKRGEGKGKRDKRENGFAAGRDCLWVGILDGWGWEFWGFGRFMVMILGSAVISYWLLVIQYRASAIVR